MIDESLCKFESLHSHYSKLNIHDTTNAFKDMEPKFWCLRHTRFAIKNVIVCDTYLHVAIGWWIILLLHWATKPIKCMRSNSTTREPTLIKKNCSKLLHKGTNLDKKNYSKLLHNKGTNLDKKNCSKLLHNKGTNLDKKFVANSWMQIWDKGELVMDSLAFMPD